VCEDLFKVESWESLAHSSMREPLSIKVGIARVDKESGDSHLIAWLEYGHQDLPGLKRWAQNLLLQIEELDKEMNDIVSSVSGYDEWMRSNNSKNGA